MNRYHPKYKIKNEDTIDSITEMFGVEESSWKRYHNNYCPHSDIIDDELPYTLKEIYILPSLWYFINRFNPKDIEPVPVEFRQGNSIYLYKLPPLRIYRANITYPQYESSIDYEMLVEGIEKVPNNVIMNFNKRNFFINKVKPDMVMDEIAVKTAEGLYPVTLRINYLKNDYQILNLNEIKQNLNKAITSVRKEYIGEIADNYLDRTVKAMVPEKITYELINNDIFFALFTHNVYESYGDSLQIDSEIRLSLGKYNSALCFKGKQWIEPVYNKMGGVYVRFQGFAQGYDKKTNSEINYQLKVEYNLACNNFSIKDILAGIIILDKEEKLPVMIAKIYELKKK